MVIEIFKNLRSLTELSPGQLMLPDEYNMSMNANYAQSADESEPHILGFSMERTPVTDEVLSRPKESYNPANVLQFEVDYRDARPEYIIPKDQRITETYINYDAIRTPKAHQKTESLSFRERPVDGLGLSTISGVVTGMEAFMGYADESGVQYPSW